MVSYCRITEGDVYLYLDVSGYLHCQGCSMADKGFRSFHAYSTVDMILHLKEHEAAGNYIPSHVYDDLIRDHKENMQFIRETAFEQLRKLEEEHGVS